MARISVTQLGPLVDRLAAAYLTTGTVKALSEALNATLGGGSEPIYPNRLHVLFSDDPEKSVNSATVDAVTTALDALPVRDVDGGIRARILAEVQSGPTTASITEIGANLQIPPAVVRYVLGDAGITPRPSAQATQRVEPISAAPDWSFQDDATRRCLDALDRAPGTKTGLVIPTAGGKTRTALRISIQFAKRHENGNIVWVTHRRDLRDQAQQEFQDLLDDGDVTLEDARIITDRMEFLMLGELAIRLADTSRPPALLIIDEAHHAAAPSYAPIFETTYALPALFLTATPNRTDDLPIGIDTIAYSITYRELANRGVVIIPEFDELPVEDFDWSSTAIADLADHVIERTKQEFHKVIILTPRIDKAEEFYAELRQRYLREPFHPLGPDDIGFVHSERNSQGVTTKEFLNDFRNKPRAIYVATQILLEGFNDPRVNAVIITYPSTSLVQLMQAAGRCMRCAPGKRRAFVLQAKNERLAYHFDYRWLYQEISDALRPQLETRDYGSAGERQRLIESLLDSHKVPAPLRTQMLSTLSDINTDAPVRLLLSGTPYFGLQERFATDAVWTGILEAQDNSAEMRWIFNDFSARGATESNPTPFLELYGRKFGFRSDAAYGSRYRSYADMLLAQYQAQCELTGKPVPSNSRPFHPNGATTWLKYITFDFRPTISPALEQFLGDCHNRDVIAARVQQQHDEFALALKVVLPLGQREAWVLTDTAAQQVFALRDDIRGRLVSEPVQRQAELYEAALAQAAGINDLPYYVIRRLDQLLPVDGFQRQTLQLRDLRKATA